MVTDIVGDLIIRLKNGSLVKKPFVIVPYSKFKYEIVKKLNERGYVGAVNVDGEVPRKNLKIVLTYKDGKNKINGVKGVSKPSRRMYTSVRNIGKVSSANSLLLLSTPKGVLTGDEAIKERVGGEILCKVW